MPEYSKIMAIDYGEKRIGIAVTDLLQIIATPLCVLDNNEQFWEKLQRLFLEHTVSEFVLGFPLREDGSDTHSTQKVREFLVMLEKKFSVPVTCIDERYSSSIAADRVKQSVTKKMKRRDKGLIDMNAAAVILEDFLLQRK